MPGLAALSNEALQTLAEHVGGVSASAHTIEAAAQSMTDTVYEALEGSVVLTRAYVTEPYGKLPDANRSFVARVAQSKNVAHELRDATPVLSLLGTTGQEKEWCDRKNSKGHVGIPLTSSSFISAVPMVAGLLQQMGVGIDWLDSEDDHIQVTSWGASGSFYVADATTEQNDRGEMIIPAQDFVSNYGVHTVFGIGDAYPSGEMAVLIVFCNEHLPGDAPARLNPVVESFVRDTAGKTVFVA